MNLKLSASFALLLFLVLNYISFGQINSGEILSDGRLPKPEQPVGCGLLLRYIDDSLSRAARNESNVILILRATNSNSIKLARARTVNISNYVKFRRFENYEVAFDPRPSANELIDIFVGGKKLYSLPIRTGDKLVLSGC